MKTGSKIIGFTALAFAAFLAVSCSEKDTTAKDVADEAKEFVNDQSENFSEKMEEKMEQIDERLDELNKKEEKSDDDKKAITYLKEKKVQLAEWLEETNKEVKDETNDALKDIRSGFNKMSDDLDDFFEKEQES